MRQTIENIFANTDPSKLDNLEQTVIGLAVSIGLVFFVARYGLKAIDSYFDWLNSRSVRTEIDRIKTAIEKNQPPYDDGQLYFPFMKDYRRH